MIRAWTASRSAGVGAVLAFAALLTALTPFGEYLDETIARRPYLALRARLGYAPRLDARVRIIAVDDRSIQRLGRQPTFGEWHAVAGLLFERGFDTVVLHAFPNLSSDRTDALQHHTKGRFIAGAASYRGEGNPRADAAAAIPARLLTRNESAATLEPSKIVLGPSAAVRSLIDGVGHMNLASDDTAPAAFSVEDGLVLPHLALVALRAPLPKSVDGMLHADFVDQRHALTERSIPAAAFFDGRTGTVRTDLSDATEASLAGGKIALLVPDAYSGGSQFVNAPTGKVPSYMVVASLMHSLLTSQVPFKPVHGALLIIAFAALLWWPLARCETRRGASVALAILTVPLIGAALSYEFLGWILPTASLAAVAIAGLVTQQAYHAVTMWRNELATSRDLELGRTVQSLILPGAMRGSIGPWDYEIAYRPFGAMSGDWVQIYAAPEGSTNGPLAVIAIGDVVGKGPSAALNTAAIASAFATHRLLWESGDFSLEAFLQSLNTMVHDTFKGQQMSTLSLAVLGRDDATLVSLGAPQWLEIQREAQVGQIRTKPSNPIGMERHLTRLGSTSMRVATGDLLVAYTDGVMDGPMARRSFRMHVEAAGLPSAEEQVFPFLVREASQAGRASVLPDDFTLLMIRRRNAA